MAKREPKSRHSTSIEVVGRAGERKGWIELGTGNVSYYRLSAKAASLRVTYQQLIEIFEKEIEYNRINEKKFKLPRTYGNSDFILSLNEVEIDDSQLSLVKSVSSIKKLDPRRIDLGTYQFSEDMANGRKSKKYTWFAQISIQAALWIVHRYIEKFLVSKKSRTYTDKNIQVSKQVMSDILIGLYKRVNS